MRYLFDTDVCIYFLNANEKIVAKTLTIPVRDIAFSIISLAELQFGAWNSAKVAYNLNRVRGFCNLFTVINLTPTVTAKFAEIKAALRKAGNVIDDFDMLIGATAIIADAILVTNNEQHFSRVEGIKTENWLA